MDTNIYHEIVILSESSNFSQAAKKMFISQPALTKKVAKLIVRYPDGSIFSFGKQ